MESRRTDIAILLLRFGFGVLMILNHGWPKLMRFFADGPLKFGDPLGIGIPASLTLATFAELVCSALVILGLYTRLAVIPLVITMIVAAFVANFGQPLPKIELALTFLIAFTTIGLTGPGWYSLDVRWRKIPL